jgi:hypothetical protein
LINKFKQAIADKCGNATAAQVIEYLHESGVLDERTMLRYVIRDEYYKRLKVGDRTCFEIKIDLAIEYGVSDTTVKNIIYNYTDIKV